MYIEINRQIIWKKVDSFFDANDSLDLKDMQKSGWKKIESNIADEKGFHYFVEYLFNGYVFKCFM